MSVSSGATDSVRGLRHRNAICLSWSGAVLGGIPVGLSVRSCLLLIQESLGNASEHYPALPGRQACPVLEESGRCAQTQVDVKLGAVQQTVPAEGHSSSLPAATCFTHPRE